MNVTRSRVALVSNMGRLWAIGGYDGMKNLSTVEVYNPETNIWSFVAPMESHEGGVGGGVIPNEWNVSRAKLFDNRNYLFPARS